MDEVDYMQGFVKTVKTHQKAANWMLQAIFLASNSTKSKMIFIGVSNHLELVTKITAEQCIKLMFKPYTESNIVYLITEKLKGLEEDPTSVINKTALLLLARRVANTSGDIRACLDSFTRALASSQHTLEKEFNSMSTTDSMDCMTSTPTRGADFDVERYKVSFRDIGMWTPTLSLNKAGQLKQQLTDLPLLQLLLLLSACKLSIKYQSCNRHVTYEDIKVC